MASGQHLRHRMNGLCSQRRAAADPDGDRTAPHRLFEIQKLFRVSKHDLRAGPVYHHLRDSIEIHSAIAFAALAVSHWIEHQPGWSIRKFIKTG